MNGRIMRPDTRPHLIVSHQPTEESACRDFREALIGSNALDNLSARPEQVINDGRLGVGAVSAMSA